MEKNDTKEISVEEIDYYEGYVPISVFITIDDKRYDLPDIMGVSAEWIRESYLDEIDHPINKEAEERALRDDDGWSLEDWYSFNIINNGVDSNGKQYIEVKTDNNEVENIISGKPKIDYPKRSTLICSNCKGKNFTISWDFEDENKYIHYIMNHPGMGLLLDWADVTCNNCKLRSKWTEEKNYLDVFTEPLLENY